MQRARPSLLSRRGQPVRPSRPWSPEWQDCHLPLVAARSLHVARWAVECLRAVASCVLFPGRDRSNHRQRPAESTADCRSCPGGCRGLCRFLSSGHGCCCSLHWSSCCVQHLLDCGLIVVARCWTAGVAFAAVVPLSNCHNPPTLLCCCPHWIERRKPLVSVVLELPTLHLGVFPTKRIFFPRNFAFSKAAWFPSR